MKGNWGCFQMTTQKKSYKPHHGKEVQEVLLQEIHSVYQREGNLRLHKLRNEKHSKEKRKIVSFPFIVIVLPTHCKMVTGSGK